MRLLLLAALAAIQSMIVVEGDITPVLDCGDLTKLCCNGDELPPDHNGKAVLGCEVYDPRNKKCQEPKNIYCCGAHMPRPGEVEGPGTNCEDAVPNHLTCPALGNRKGKRRTPFLNKRGYCEDLRDHKNMEQFMNTLPKPGNSFPDGRAGEGVYDPINYEQPAGAGIPLTTSFVDTTPAPMDVASFPVAPAGGANQQSGNYPPAPLADENAISQLPQSATGFTNGGFANPFDQTSSYPNS